MKHVRKGGEPEAFREWKALAGSDWQPAWSDLGAPEKPDLLAALVQEQGAVCCYCGRRITHADSHIEHFRPRTDYPDRILDYTNLLASCQRHEEKRMPRICGHAKGGWFDEACHVDPQNPEWESRFRFGSQGNVKAKPDDGSAETMVEKLNLNAPILTRVRLEILESIFPEDVLLDEDNQALQDRARSYTQPDEHGCIPEMAHAVRRWLEDFLGTKI